MALFNITRPESIINPLYFSSRKVKLRFPFIAVCKYNILSSWRGKSPQLNHLVQHCFSVTGTSLHNNNLTSRLFIGLSLSGRVILQHICFLLKWLQRQFWVSFWFVGFLGEGTTVLPGFQFLLEALSPCCHPLCLSPVNQLPDSLFSGFKILLPAESEVMC